MLQVCIIYPGISIIIEEIWRINQSGQPKGIQMNSDKNNSFSRLAIHWYPRLACQPLPLAFASGNTSQASVSIDVCQVTELDFFLTSDKLDLKLTVSDPMYCMV
jgi:hypothetical protein